MQLNYFGTLRVLKAFLPGMVKKGHGQVVLVSSAAAVCGVAGYSSYAPSKAAVRSLADTLRNEVLPLRICVLEKHCLCCCLHVVCKHINSHSLHHMLSCMICEMLCSSCQLACM